MFTIERIELLNWDIQDNQILVLQDGVNLLTGENGSGKTAVLDAIKVALGASHIGGGRPIDFYLRAREAPYVMVRLVVANPADPATRGRPFDVLGGGFESDRVSLAMVAKAADDGYEKRWFILDGDTSPLAPGINPRPFERLADYQDRLEKLGLGRSFRALICTPQGDVASFCRRNPSDVFDLLYDIIGGKDALEEWERLKKDYEQTRQQHETRLGELAEREQRHNQLRSRLAIHERFLRVRRRLDLNRLALPLARSRVLTARQQACMDRARSLDREVQDAERRAAEAREQRALTATRHEDARATTDRLDADCKAVRAEAEVIAKAWANAQTQWGSLDQLREQTEHLPVRDLDALEAAAEEERTEAGRKEAEGLALEREDHELEAELRSIADGILPPPEPVRLFRDALRREGVTEHMLLADLLEPQLLSQDDRHALESFLGDLRFAIAVPDVVAFARAIAVARRERFPFYVLAPDVKARRPLDGEHPFLDAVRVKEPRYEGLVNRLLRWVRRLDVGTAVTDTFREPGARVAASGFVLDRVGGVYKGTDRFFLGREALEVRKKEVETRREAIHAEAQVLSRARKAHLASARVLESEARQERLRRDWEERRAEHARLVGELRVLENKKTQLDLDADRLGTEGRLAWQKADQLNRDLRDLDAAATRETDLANEKRTAAEQARAEAQRMAAEVVDGQARADAARSTLRDRGVEFADEAEACAREKLPEAVEALLRREEEELQSFQPEDMDEALPGNVRTLERQVEDVRDELGRLATQAEADREKVDRAHDQYRRFTRNRFRLYFDRLRSEAERIRFKVEGSLTERIGGRFDLGLQVSVGDKAPVPYDSAALSGGEKAALSILMAMSAIERGDGGGPGFFLIDEPFSASDTHKIQELGTFLARTGAQYLISMPTTMDIARCGSWLQAVLTCTKTLGGGDARAPRVKCSYVERANA